MGLETFFTPSEQTMFFLYSVVLGACLGVVFDCFRVARIILPHTTFFVAVEDILFIFIWAVSLVVFSMELTRGEVRFYYLAGNILGFTVYYFTVGKIVVTIIKTVVMVISKILKFLFKIFVKPILKLFVLVSQICYKLFVRIYSKLNFFSNRLKIHLKDRRKLLYNNPTRKKNKKEVNKVEKSRRKKIKRRHTAR